MERVIYVVASPNSYDPSGIEDSIVLESDEIRAGFMVQSLIDLTAEYLAGKENFTGCDAGLKFDDVLSLLDNDSELVGFLSARGLRYAGHKSEDLVQLAFPDDVLISAEEILEFKAVEG